jgi:hypothetical protein
VQELPLLSAQEVFSRERLHFEGGDLREGLVIIAESQPDLEYAHQAYHNIDKAIHYHMFFEFREATVEKCIQGLQIVAASAVRNDETSPGYSERYSYLSDRRSEVLEYLTNIARKKRLLVTFLPHEQTFRFRCHNAMDPQLARLYIRHPNRQFALWAEGRPAVALSETTKEYVDTSKIKDQFFVGSKAGLKGDQYGKFRKALDEGIHVYFPGLENEVRRLCLGREEKESSTRSG